MKQTMNFLFTTWEGGGNVTPALEVVRKLVARGHRVRVLGEECNRPESEAAGATFVAWRSAPSRKSRSRECQPYKDWAAATPQEGLLHVFKEVWCGPALAYAQDTINELRRERADLVVTSETLFGVMAGCEKLGQKFVTLAPNLSLAPLPGVPPMGPGLPPARTEQEKAMHAEILKGTLALFDAGLPAVNAAREALGLKPLAHLLDQLQGAEAELLATSRAFDFPSPALPQRVRYVGPQLADPSWTQAWLSPWPDSDTRPLVTAGFSTTFQNHASVLQKVIDAFAPLPVRLLITLGGSIKRDELKPAANCVLVDSAPHSQVMSQAALVVTHGGHGTVMRALSSRVPMLVIPHGRDQNDNAVRVTERGAGLSLPANTPVEGIRASGERILKDPSFRIAAKKLGDQIAADAENSTVVQELETAATANRSSQHSSSANVPRAGSELCVSAALRLCVKSLVNKLELSRN